VPHDDHRKVATAVPHQQFHAATPSTGTIRRQQPAPDEWFTPDEQGQGGGAALFGRQIWRHLRPVGTVMSGQPVGDSAAVRDGVSDPSLSGCIPG
jgi:hypothetical protein